MSSRNIPFVVHPSKGGLNTTDPPGALGPDDLVMATNVEYDQSGSRKKRGGSAKYNASALTISTDVTFLALADFWRFGTSWTTAATQKFVTIAATAADGGIFKDDGDGVWDTLLGTGFGTTAQPASIMIGQGHALFLHPAARTQRWDGTTLTASYTASETFGFGSYHLRRAWLGGDGGSQILVSTVKYSAAGDITDITGADTGSIVFDEDDGDKVIGISKPFRGRIYIFKGPNVGSIHEIAGTTPSTFTTRAMYKGGVPCIGHNSIVTTPNDIFWASRYGIHSLLATDKYGDLEEAFLSHPIQSTYRGLNLTKFAQSCGFYDPTRNQVGWFFANGSDTTNTLGLVYNLVTQRWSTWTHTGFDVASAMVALTPTTQVPRLYMGAYDGFVYAGNQTTKNDVSSAFTYQIQTPILYSFGRPEQQIQEKQFDSVVTFYKPRSSQDQVTLGVAIEGRSQSYPITLDGGGDLLDSSFILDTSVLDGAPVSYIETIIEDRGRNIQLSWTQSGTSQDVEIYGYGLRYMPAETNAHERA